MEKETVGIISKKFWITFINRYVSFIKKIYGKGVKYGVIFLFNYGFDVLLIIGNIFI